MSIMTVQYSPSFCLLLSLSPCKNNNKFPCARGEKGEASSTRYLEFLFFFFTNEISLFFFFSILSFIPLWQKYFIINFASFSLAIRFKILCRVKGYLLFRKFVLFLSNKYFYIRSTVGIPRATSFCLL